MIAHTIRFSVIGEGRLPQRGVQVTELLAQTRRPTEENRPIFIRRVGSGEGRSPDIHEERGDIARGAELLVIAHCHDGGDDVSELPE